MIAECCERRNLLSRDIASRHAPLITNLKPGSVRVETTDGEERFFYVTGGILEVQPHLVTVLADSVLHADKLDEDAALAGHERAKEALEGRADEVDPAQAELVEAEARYRAAQKLKRTR